MARRRRRRLRGRHRRGRARCRWPSRVPGWPRWPPGSRCRRRTRIPTSGPQSRPRSPPSPPSRASAWRRAARGGTDLAGHAARWTGPGRENGPGRRSTAPRPASPPGSAPGCAAASRSSSQSECTGPRRIRCMFRWLTAGESHGRALVAVCEGVPSGVRLTTEDLAAALARRRAGYGRGARMTFEQDEVELTAGVRHGVTLGGPVAIRIANTEWPKWETVMSADPVDRGGTGRAGQERPADQAAPRARRPGRHAEVRPHRRPARAGAGQRAGDGRPGRPRRGGPAPAQPGARHRDPQPRGGPRRRSRRRTASCPDRRTRPPSTPTRCAAPTPHTSQAMVAEIDAVRKDGDTLGGVVEVLAYGAAARAGQLHPLGPAARRPAGRGADVHPGHQGRRGRGRLHHRYPPRVASARRDRERPRAA